MIFHTFREDMKKKLFIVHLFLSENIFAKPSQEKYAVLGKGSKINNS